MCLLFFRSRFSIKYPGINLTRIRKTCTENHKALRRLKMSPTHGKTSHARGSEEQRHNVRPTRRNLHFECNPYRLPTAFLTEAEQTILKSVRTHKDPEESTSEKQEQNGRYHKPRFQDSLPSWRHQNGMVSAQTRTRRIGSPEISP